MAAQDNDDIGIEIGTGIAALFALACAGLCCFRRGNHHRNYGRLFGRRRAVAEHPINEPFAPPPPVVMHTEPMPPPYQPPIPIIAHPIGGIMPQPAPERHSRVISEGGMFHPGPIAAHPIGGAAVRIGMDGQPPLPVVGRR